MGFAFGSAGFAGVHEMSPVLPFESLINTPMPGVGDVERVAPFFGFAADFFATGAGAAFFVITAGASGAGAGADVLASWAEVRAGFDALFMQLSGSSEQRAPAYAAVDISATAAIAKSSWSGRIRFTWASDRTLPVRE